MGDFFSIQLSRSMELVVWFHDTPVCKHRRLGRSLSMQHQEQGRKA